MTGYRDSSFELGVWLNRPEDATCGKPSLYAPVLRCTLPRIHDRRHHHDGEQFQTWWDDKTEAVR